MSAKNDSRLRRARRARARMRTQGVNRLSVHRTPRHIYAQVIGPDGGTVLVSASSLEQEVRKGVKTGGNVEAAAIVGASAAGGGCINAARTVELADGRRFFVKSNPDPLPGMFEREAEGRPGYGRLLGESPAMKALFRQMDRVALRNALEVLGDSNGRA